MFTKESVDAEDFRIHAINRQTAKGLSVAI